MRRSSSPVSRFDGRWLLVLAAAVALVLVIRLLPGSPAEPPLHLVALGADGTFHDTLYVPASWRDTATGATVRVPLVLGVRNTGARPARPARLSVSLPVRFRLTDSGARLTPELQVGSPLVTYAVDTELGPVEPGRLPSLLPGLDTVWLEMLIPAYHCVLLGDSVPEFIPAAPPPVSAMSDVRMFYSFDGGDLAQRRTGTLSVRLDTALLAVDVPPMPPSFPVVADTARASPDVGELRYAGSRLTPCGGPQNPLMLRSTLWFTAAGGRVILLAHGGTVRKRLYDLNGDGVLERESWDADGDGTFETTRQARLPIPGPLLPVQIDSAGTVVPADG